jgi:hypothetical protein
MTGTRFYDQAMVSSQMQRKFAVYHNKLSRPPRQRTTRKVGTKGKNIHVGARLWPPVRAEAKQTDTVVYGMVRTILHSGNAGIRGTPLPMDVNPVSDHTSICL